VHLWREQVVDLSDWSVHKTIVLVLCDHCAFSSFHTVSLLQI